MAEEKAGGTPATRAKNKWNKNNYDSFLRRVIDTNAHVENLKCEIITEGGNAIAKISFTN